MLYSEIQRTDGAILQSREKTPKKEIKVNELATL